MVSHNDPGSWGKECLGPEVGIGVGWGAACITAFNTSVIRLDYRLRKQNRLRHFPMSLHMHICTELHSFFSLLSLGDIVGKFKTYYLKWSGTDIAEIQKGEKSNFQLSLPN